MTNDERFEEIRKELKAQKEQIVDLEKGQISTDILVKNFTDVSKELSCTMKNIEKTMVGIQINLKDNTKDIANMNYKFDKLDERIQEEADKNMIDVREINKQSAVENIKKYGVGLGSTFALIYGLYEVLKVIGDKI